MQKTQILDKIQELKQEHLEIERELFELETIIYDSENGDNINYSNFIHVCRKIYKIWEEHEKKEERFFPVLYNNGIIVPVTILHLNHIELRKYRENLNKAIKSGNNKKIQDSIKTDLK